MSDYDYDDYGEDDYAEPARNELSLVEEYFPSAGAADDYDEDEYDAEDTWEDAPTFDAQPAPQFDSSLAANTKAGFEMLRDAAFQAELGPYAAGLAQMARDREEWDQRRAAENAAQAEATLAEGMSVAGSIIEQEIRAGGLHMNTPQEIIETADEIYRRAVSSGLEANQELARASITAACQLLRNAEISRAALAKV